jgi:hypothetical protein
MALIEHLVFRHMGRAPHVCEGDLSSLDHSSRGTGALVRGADNVPMILGLYIVSAYWFTASTSFANPAVTLARSLTDTFAGIHPAGVPAFVLAQFTGAVLATAFSAWLFELPPRSTHGT